MMLPRGGLPRPEITLVVEVDAVSDGVKAALPGEIMHHLEQLILAVKAALPVVLNILRALHLGGVNDFKRNALLPGKGCGVLKLGAGQAGRIRDDGEHVLPQRLARRPRQISRIHAAGVGDQSTSQVLERSFEAGLFFRQSHR